MNYAYKNYLYIYNIKLIEENTLLVKKTIFKHIFCFICSKKLFLLTQLNIFFRTKTVFQNLFPKHNFFFFLKIFLKNYFLKQF